MCGTGLQTGSNPRSSANPSAYANGLWSVSEQNLATASGTSSSGNHEGRPNSSIIPWSGSRDDSGRIVRLAPAFFGVVPPLCALGNAELVQRPSLPEQLAQPGRLHASPRPLMPWVVRVAVLYGHLDALPGTS